MSSIGCSDRTSSARGSSADRSEVTCYRTGSVNDRSHSTQPLDPKRIGKCTSLKVGLYQTRSLPPLCSVVEASQVSHRSRKLNWDRILPPCLGICVLAHGQSLPAVVSLLSRSLGLIPATLGSGQNLPSCAVCCFFRSRLERETSGLTSPRSKH